MDLLLNVLVVFALLLIFIFFGLGWGEDGDNKLKRNVGALVWIVIVITGLVAIYPYN